MEVGKLPASTLKELLARVKLDDRVVVGPKVGEDAAVIDYGDTLLIAKTDPITFATDQIGWYAVNINANDIAVMGGDPRWFLATILVPPGTAEDAVSRVFDQILSACEALSVSLVGGHTEITYGLERPIVVGCMLGEVTRRGLVTTGGAKPGDSIILTKGIAVEGSGVLAREADQRLRDSGVPAEALAKARDFIFRPGISVVAEARAVRALASSMHDPTEGGLATGLSELAAAAGVGLVVYEDKIPILPETRAICDSLGLDPLGLITSGSLLFTATPENEAEALSALASIGVPAAVIGTVVEPERGLKLLSPAGDGDMPSFDRDEIARVFEGR